MITTLLPRFNQFTNFYKCCIIFHQKILLNREIDTMILPFPYSTDAPIYYWPYITVSMIVVNILAFVFTIPDLEVARPLMLAVGDGLHPVQWLTHNFLHVGFMHLIGNMLFLWSFGIVVEGKLGPWKSLIVYLGSGIIHGASVQVIMLSHEPNVCLGASAIVFAMMMICLIWAPENSMNCLLVVFFMIFFRLFFFEVRIKIMVGIYIALEVLILVLRQGELSSEYLHVTGAVIGLVVGLVLLKSGQVDCENWDIFSVMAGRHTMTSEERAKLAAAKPKAKREKAKEEHKRKDRTLDEIRWAVSQGNVLPAIMLCKQMRLDFPDWVLPEQDLLNLVQALLDKGMRDESLNAMREYLAHYTAKASMVRLKITHLLIEMKQPAAALKTLDRIIPGELNERQQEFYRKLSNHLQKTANRNDTYELAEDGY